MQLYTVDIDGGLKPFVIRCLNCQKIASVKISEKQTETEKLKSTKSKITRTCVALC